MYRISEIAASRVVAVVLIGSIAGFATGCGRAPTDAQLTTLLRRNVDELTQLCSMMKVDDALVEITQKRFVEFGPGENTKYQPTANLSSDRWDSYRKLLRESGVRSIIRPLTGDNGQSDDVHFVVHTEGFVFSGSRKGLVCSAAELSPLYKTLDVRPHELDRGYGYRAIQDGWYIFLE